ADGRVRSVHHKALLPTYDIFDEYRYFEPASEFRIAELNGKRLAITICEDIWNMTDQPMYSVRPMDSLAGHNPDFIINIAASPFDYSHDAQRLGIIASNARQYGLPVYYVNHCGAQTELIFDGGSLVTDKLGGIVRRLPLFEEGLLITGEEKTLPPPPPPHPPGKTELMHRALITGIHDYFDKLGFKQAIIGLSGGIDSALTLALAAEALGPGNVLAVMMPSPYSSKHSVADSEKMISTLDCPSLKIPIDSSFQSFREVLATHFKGYEPDVTEENMQARIRAMILMALSNKMGYVLLNTSNKSEAAVGYGTLYGDMAGGLSVLGDVYKTDVYKLAEYANRNIEVIPPEIMAKAPSAELRPGQKDSDSLPDYNILDRILFQYIEEGKSPDQISGFPQDLVGKVLKMVHSSEYKRQQTPPILRVSPKAFGMGRRMPIVARYVF
ncbi:MAG: NAD+ synthase, partial [Flavobacteriales bacterium]